MSDRFLPSLTLYFSPDEESLLSRLSLEERRAIAKAALLAAANAHAPDTVFAAPASHLAYDRLRTRVQEVRDKCHQSWSYLRGRERQSVLQYATCRDWLNAFLDELEAEDGEASATAHVFRLREQSSAWEQGKTVERLVATWLQEALADAVVSSPPAQREESTDDREAISPSARASSGRKRSRRKTPTPAS